MISPTNEADFNQYYDMKKFEDRTFGKFLVDFSLLMTIYNILQALPRPFPQIQEGDTSKPIKNIAVQCSA